MGQKPLDLQPYNAGGLDIQPYGEEPLPPKPLEQHEKSHLRRFDEHWVNKSLFDYVPEWMRPGGALRYVGDTMMDWSDKDPDGMYRNAAKYGGAWLHNVGSGVDAMATPLNIATMGVGGAGLYAAKAAANLQRAGKVADAANKFKTANNYQLAERLLSAPEVVAGTARLKGAYETGNLTDAGTGLAQLAGGGMGLFGPAYKLPDAPVPPKNVTPTTPDTGVMHGPVGRDLRQGQLPFEDIPAQPTQPYMPGLDPRVPPRSQGPNYTEFDLNPPVQQGIDFGPLRSRLGQFTKTPDWQPGPSLEMAPKTDKLFDTTAGEWKWKDSEAPILAKSEPVPESTVPNNNETIVELRSPSKEQTEELRNLGFEYAGVNDKNFIIYKKSPNAKPVTEAPVNEAATGPDGTVYYNPDEAFVIPKEKLTFEYIATLKDQGVGLVRRDEKGNGIFQRLINEDEGSLNLGRLGQLWNRFTDGGGGNQRTPQQMDLDNITMARPGELDELSDYWWRRRVQAYRAGDDEAWEYADRMLHEVDRRHGYVEGEYEPDTYRDTRRHLDSNAMLSSDFDSLPPQQQDYHTFIRDNTDEAELARQNRPITTNLYNLSETELLSLARDRRLSIENYRTLDDGTIDFEKLIRDLGNPDQPTLPVSIGSMEMGPSLDPNFTRNRAYFNSRRADYGDLEPFQPEFKKKVGAFEVPLSLTKDTFPPLKTYNYLPDVTNRVSARETMADYPRGEPGLQTKTNDNKNFTFIYRNKDGYPVAMAEGNPNGITALYADDTKGIAYARGVKAVLEAAAERGMLQPSGSYSKYTKQVIDHFRRLLKEDEGSLNLGKLPIRFGQPPPDIKVPGQKPKPKEPSLMNEMFNLPRAINTTLDLSAPLRQGLPLMFTRAFLNSWEPMFKALGSEAAFKEVTNKIKARKMFQNKIDSSGKIIPSDAEQWGVKLSEIGTKLSKREEAIASTWVESGRFLGGENAVSNLYARTLGRGARASNRAYTAFLNQLRADTLETLIGQAKALHDADRAAGIAGGNPDPYIDIPFGKEIGDFVNTATGRGPLRTNIPNAVWKDGQLHLGSKERSLESAADKLSIAFFSPRLIASRVRMLNPWTYTKASPFVRKQYLKAALTTIGAWGTMAMMAKAVGANVETDMTSADYGKIKVGNTRLDPAGGFQQYLVALARIATGVYSTTTGRKSLLGSGYKADTDWDVLVRFGINKLQPFAKFGADMSRASEHQPVHVYDRTAQLFIPLIVQDAWELMNENPEMLPALLPVAFGMGSQTYDKKDTGGRIVPKAWDWKYGGGSKIPDFINPYVEEY